MSAVTIYHNPGCSKSRAALALLRSRGIEPRIVKYLEAPPDAAELSSVIGKLGMRPADLVRKGESAYKSNYAGRTLSDAEWIEALVRHPALIERPIVVAGERAVIGRPLENVLRLLKS